MPPKLRSYRELKVWQRAFELAIVTYQLTRWFPAEELYGLRQQVRKAAVSVPSNIAEGYSRDTTTDDRRFLAIARGSLSETETQLLLARELGFAQAQNVDAALAKASEVDRMLVALSRSLKGRK